MDKVARGAVEMGWPIDFSWYKLLTDWGGLIAGILGFVAAIGAVLLAMGGEKRKAKRELESLRRALGVEVRLYTANALTAHYYCKSLNLSEMIRLRYLQY